MLRKAGSSFMLVSLRIAVVFCVKTLRYQRPAVVSLVYHVSGYKFGASNRCCLLFHGSEGEGIGAAKSALGYKSYDRLSKSIGVFKERDHCDVSTVAYGSFSVLRRFS